MRQIKPKLKSNKKGLCIHNANNERPQQSLLNIAVIKMIILCVVLITSVISPSHAEDLRLGRYFSDEMVLQRGKKTVIRGMAKALADVQLSFAGQNKKTKADDRGRWEITLNSLKANPKSMDLTVTSDKQSIVLKNILVGDVILFARQSSIDISLGRDPAGHQIARNMKASSSFRAITIRTIPSPQPQHDLDKNATDGWNEVDQKQALIMSSAACLLGRDLAPLSDVPLGIVDLQLGYHFPIAWLSKKTVLEPYPGTGPTVNRAQKIAAQYEAFIAKEPFGKKGKLITENPLDNALYPSAGYNGTILPLRGLGLKGMIVQIGNDYPYMYYEKAKAEGRMGDRELMNTNYVKTYDIRKEGFRMEPAMLSRLPREWRSAFGEDNLPFAYIAPPSSKLWPYAVHNREMREIQRRVSQKQPHVSVILPGMENIPFSGQPRDEALLAERSLKWVRATLYQENTSSASGPVFKSIEGEGNEVSIHFKEGTAKGLKAKKGALDYFEVADVDSVYVTAKALIEGQSIRLSSSEIPRIFYVRYNWNENPNQGLVNGDQLPALPFRSEEASHRWLVRYQDNDLAEEYYTPANKWKNGSVTLINGQLERYGYRHFSGWLGPIGIKTGPFGPNMGVREVRSGSPAAGKVLVGDVIYSVNGKMLGEEEEMVMSVAITKSEALDGKLTLGLHRDGKNYEIELQLKVMGRYSATSPWNCIKTERIVENLEKYLAEKGAPLGFLSTSQLFMLGAGSPKYQWMVRKSALIEKNIGTNNWELGYRTIYLSEYFLSTGDKRVLSQIKNLCDLLAEHQIRDPESKRDGGWYGRGTKKRGYPAMAHTGLSAMLGLTLAIECGVEVKQDTFKRGLAYLKRKGAHLGQIIYGDAFRSSPALIDPEKMLAGKLSTYNGKVAEAAVLYRILGDTPAAHINSMISTHAWYSTYSGHGGNFWNNLWTPLGAAAHSKESFIYFMKNHRWYRECNRMYDGGLLVNVANKFEAGTGLALVVPRRRLRILGAAKSPFSPNAPEILNEALAAYTIKNYELAEKLSLALVIEGKTDKENEATVNKLAEESRRMQDGIISDLTQIQVLIEKGRMHEAKMILASLESIVAEKHQQLTKVKNLLQNAKARQHDQLKYETALKQGKSNDIDESLAMSSADLKKMRAEKKADLDTRKWISLTPKEFIPAKKNKTLGLDQLPADKATKWKFKVLESRDNAPEGWIQSDYNDSSWKPTVHPVSWHLNHVTLFRTSFDIQDQQSYDLLKFRSWIFRQQDVMVYLNGTLIGRINNIERKTGSIEFPFKKVALNALRKGENTLAISTRQNWRWGMLGMRVYNGGFDFTLNARLSEQKQE